MKRERFWDLPQWAKYDELQDDGSDGYLILPALSDSETDVYVNDKDNYTLYGPTEGLLYRPKHLVTRIGMELYCAVCLVIRKRE